MLKNLSLSTFCLTGSLSTMNGLVPGSSGHLSSDETQSAQTRDKSSYAVSEFHGTARECGRAYGNSQAEAITISLSQLQADTFRLTYAERCCKILEEWKKPVFEFVQGMAEGTKRPLEEIVLLLLAEEIGHSHHCTAIGATRSGTVDGSAVLGQNWDSSGSAYFWSSLLRLRTDSMPATLTYAYPGLWACAGINEHGLSLVWTTSGVWPWVPPDVGVPTYALIAGILTQRTCREALTLLQNTRNAGAFIFFLADATGDVWVIEGLPGQVHPVECIDVVTRANHFETEEMCRLSKQELPPKLDPNSVSRAKRMAELAKAHRGQINGTLVASFLTDHGVGPGLDICDHTTHPGGVFTGELFTLDSYYLLPSNRQMWIARGLPCRHTYEKYTV
jgi:hypothetical protein